MEHVQYEQRMASLGGLTLAHFDALLQTLHERQDAEGVQRLFIARPAQEQFCPRCQRTQKYIHGVDFGPPRFFVCEQTTGAFPSIVEADETFFTVSYKGKRSGLPRTPKRREGKTKDGSGAEKTTVVVVQRGTQVAFVQVLECAMATTQTQALRPVMGLDAVLSTDGNAS